MCSLIFGANHCEARRKALNKPRDLSVKDCIDYFCYSVNVQHSKTLLKNDRHAIK